MYVVGGSDPLPASCLGKGKSPKAIQLHNLQAVGLPPLSFSICKMGPMAPRADVRVGNAWKVPAQGLAHAPPCIHGGFSAQEPSRKQDSLSVSRQFGVAITLAFLRKSSVWKEDLLSSGNSQGRRQQCSLSPLPQTSHPCKRH